TSGKREQAKIPFRNSSSYLHGAPRSNSKFSGLTQMSHIGIRLDGGSNAPENLFGSALSIDVTHLPASFECIHGFLKFTSASMKASGDESQAVERKRIQMIENNS
ncbi:unnamed protein product, partial [Schistosoma margrebowiei]